MHYAKKTLLAAAIAALGLTLSFPALADEPVGTNVTVVSASEEDTPPEPEENAGGHFAAPDTKRRRADVTGQEEYVDQGPGAAKKEEQPKGPQETSLGRFTITGYCGCEQCSGGHNLTYSGAVPSPDHTVSADLSQFPIGTRLKVDGTVYTVEDKGSSVNKNMLDIFYGSHEEALAKGTYTAEVFLVQN